MSWLSIPLPNPFKSLQFSDDEQEGEEEPANDAVSPADGVKEDLSTIGETIGRKLRAFISPETSNTGNGEPSSSRTFEGIRSDLEEIKGTFKSSLSILSSNRAVSEISKLASNFLQLNDVDYVNSNRNNNDGDDEDEEEEDVGVNDEVIQFAQQISNRPELWTEFPLSLDHEFDISEVQYEHASIVEQLVPSLAELRSRISSQMSEKQFWMIYFILLLPRLNEEDSELLSTPETAEARETLLKMLRAKKNEETNSENPQLDSSSESDNEVHDTSIINSQSVENVITSKNSNESNKSDSKPESSIRSLVTEEHGKIDNWEEEEEKLVTAGTSAGAPKQFQSEDDVSFSDLEDDDNDLPNKQSTSRSSRLTKTSSPEAGSSEWVRLNNNVVEDRGSLVKGQSSLRERDSEGEDSTGWLTVDDFDP